MRLRQIALVANELRPVEDALREQLGLEVCFRDPGLAYFNLRHGMYPIGDRFLEVVAPKGPGTTAGRLLDRRGDGGYMILVQADLDDDLDVHKARLDEEGIRVIHDGQIEEVVSRKAGREPAVIRGIHLHPKDVGGAIISIDRSDPPESWGWAGYDWAYHSRPEVVTDISAIELQAADPDDMAQRWGRALAHEVASAATGPVIHLSDAVIRFVEATDGRGDGFAGVDLTATDRNRAGETLEICGMRFNLT